MLRAMAFFLGHKRKNGLRRKKAQGWTAGMVIPRRCGATGPASMNTADANISSAVFMDSGRGLGYPGMTSGVGQH
jgi:hypothetical protein